MSDATPADLIIEGGTVIDGSGAPGMHADLAIRGDRILAIGDLSAMPALSRRKADGLCVAPGFIDAHTHDDLLVLEPPEGAHPKLSQGVTTVITGNCGLSLAPLFRERSNPPPPPLTLLGVDAWRYRSFAQYLDALDRARPAVNAACLVGHTTLRTRHMASLDRSATEVECRAMAADLADCLESGAIGMSTGLYYPPARPASQEEVIAVGTPLKRMGGLLTMHIRDEGVASREAIDEALAIGRALDTPVVISHHKLNGKSNHGRSDETLAQIEAASATQSVCMDCYPYNASSTILKPDMLSESSDVLITFSEKEPDAAGRSLFEMARERGMTPQALAEQLQPAGAIYFSMSDVDVDRILSHPLTMIGSDGLAHDARPHPRLWGTFPRVLGHYARDRKLFSLEQAVHKMTGLTARRFGLKQRGTLAPGQFADLVIFDAGTVLDRANFAESTLVSQGIEAVFVNGRLACEQGRTVDAHAGRALRRG